MSSGYFSLGLLLEGSSGVPGPWGPWSSSPGCVAWGMRWMKPDTYSLEGVNSLLERHSPAGGPEDRGGGSAPCCHLVTSQS